jgi:predicted ABC-type ATPase
MRVFAGPNGSGKSTIKDILPSDLLGYYLNPDDLEKALRIRPILDLNSFQLTVSWQAFQDFLKASTLIHKLGILSTVQKISVTANVLDVSNVPIDAYLASVLVDLLRSNLIKAGRPFTFETVMSSVDKLEVLQQAKHNGFRNYLYYIATEDPIINVDRVRHRVNSGGHPVPEEKIISRYYRSLDHLFEAIQLTERAYLFDNSGETRTWVAEVTGGRKIELKTDNVPNWFISYVENKIS